MKNYSLIVFITLSTVCACKKQIEEKDESLSIQEALATTHEIEGFNKYLCSVIHGNKEGKWTLTTRSNVPPESTVSLNDGKLPLPMVDYGYSFSLFESNGEAKLLHIYLRESSEINSPDPNKGIKTFKFEDVKNELIGKFKETESWTLIEK